MTDKPLLLELTVQEGGSIQTNVNEIVTAVNDRLKKYRYVVNETNTRQAKEDAAALRKIARQSQSERSRIKKILLDSWKDPNDQLMQLEKRLKATADELAQGVDQVDQKRRDLLTERYREYWQEIAHGQFPFEAVFEPSYLNKTAKEKEVKEDLQRKLSQLQTELEMIRGMLPDLQSVDGVMCIQDFCQTGNVSKAMETAQRIRKVSEELAMQRAEDAAKEQHPMADRFWRDQLDPVIPGDPTEVINHPMAEQSIPIPDPAVTDLEPALITDRWIVTAPQDVLRRAYGTLRQMGVQIKVEKV